MKYILSSALAFILAFGALMAQDITQESYWKTLSKITYKKEYNELLGFKIDMPVFAPSVVALEGETIELTGYIIPTEGYKSHKEFIFSALPYNLCFFCGGAGPETVVEVSSLKPIKYTADPIRIQGTLELNRDDINRLMYALRDVKEIKG